MAGNILICTLIMWGLTTVAVVPLANRLFRNALVKGGTLALEGRGPATKELIEEHRSLYTTKFIQSDVMVMGIAGLIAGLAGLQLIGFAWKAKAWPGLLALIAASFLGHAIQYPKPF